jgi:DNA-binding MarR family transcriptional regulator
MNDSDLRHLVEVDRLIHEPARLLIVTTLYTVEKADFLFVLTNTGLTKGNLSAHLTKLESAGYVEIQKTYRGKIPQTLLTLTPIGRAAFETYRKQLKHLADQLPEGPA